MKLYLCARFSQAASMRMAERIIHCAAGPQISVCSRWHHEDRAGDKWDGESPGAARVRARENLDDLHEADALLYFNDKPEDRSTHGGRDFAMGYAVAYEKLVLVIGRASHIYCHADKVAIVPDLTTAIHICGAWHLMHAQQKPARGVDALLEKTS